MADARPDLWSSFRDLAERSWQIPLENARRTGRHLGQVLDGQQSATDLVRETGRFVRQEYGDYARDVAATGLSVASAVIDMNLRYQRRFVDQVFAAGREADLRLSASPGQRVQVELTLDNDLAEPAQVEVRPGALASRGQDAVHDAISVDPAAFALEPGASATVQVVVDLADAAFAPGQRWAGALEVSGIGAQPRTITLQIDVTEPVAAT